MGCFLACFGITKKRRQKGSTKNAPGDQSYGKYVPLDSNATVKLDSDDEMQKASATKLRDKPKESATAKIKKKVSFNLNVKIYEPLPKDEISTYLSESEKAIWDYNEEETAEASMKCLKYGEDLMASQFGSFPSNYRYQNCRDSYDEEDEIELEESDLDDDDDELDFDADNVGEIYDNASQNISQGELSKLNSASMKVEEKGTAVQLSEKTKNNLKQLQALPSQKLNKTESNQNARNRSQHALPVLNPVENLTQWIEVKAKAKQQLKHQKENIMLEQEQHVLPHMKKSYDSSALNSSSQSNHFKPLTHKIAVDASLSSWLISSGRESNAMYDIDAVGQEHQKKSRWLYQSHSADKIEQF